MSPTLNRTAWRVEDMTPALVEDYRYQLKRLFDAMIEGGCPVKSEEMHASIDLLCDAALIGVRSSKGVAR